MRIPNTYGLPLILCATKFTYALKCFHRSPRVDSHCLQTAGLMLVQSECQAARVEFLAVRC